MQLDLLLRSLEKNGGGYFIPTHVLWRASTEEFHVGYKTCMTDHPSVSFELESDLADQVRYLLYRAEHVTFFTDDDVIYRPLPSLVPLPLHGWLCFSLRLGRNTTWCYPHGRKQGLPRFFHGGDILAWYWWNADGDFGYAASLDGHIFRGETLRRALEDLDRVKSPNQIEDHLVHAFAGDPRPMGSYRESHLVGVPANRVNGTHPNRNGEEHSYDVAGLNKRYLAGERVDIDALAFDSIVGAHQELELVFNG